MGGGGERERQRRRQRTSRFQSPYWHPLVCLLSFLYTLPEVKCLCSEDQCPHFLPTSMLSYIFWNFEPAALPSPTCISLDHSHRYDILLFLPMKYQTRTKNLSSFPFPCLCSLSLQNLSAMFTISSLAIVS